MGRNIVLEAKMQDLLPYLEGGFYLGGLDGGFNRDDRYDVKDVAIARAGNAIKVREFKKVEISYTDDSGVSLQEMVYAIGCGEMELPKTGKEETLFFIKVWFDDKEREVEWMGISRLTKFKVLE